MRRGRRPGRTGAPSRVCCVGGARDQRSVARENGGLPTRQPWNRPHSRPGQAARPTRETSTAEAETPRTGTLLADAQFLNHALVALGIVLLEVIQ